MGGLTNDKLDGKGWATRMHSLLLVLLAVAFLPGTPVQLDAPQHIGWAQSPEPEFQQWSAPPAFTIDPEREYFATVATNFGGFDIHLFAADAPLAVNNFVFLASQGFYDGVPFHRIIENFMIQTGDPTGTGRGGPGYQFGDEPVTRGYDRGIVAMANAGPNTNGSQFFIVHGSAVSLPPNYTIFGEIVSGLAVVDEIASVPVSPSTSNERSVPQVDAHIERVSITVQ